MGELRLVAKSILRYIPAVHTLKKAWTWLKWPLALALLGYLWYQNRDALAKLRDHEKNWSYLAFAFLLIGGSTLLTFLRWYLLVSAQGFAFRVRDAMRLGFLGLLFNYVAPGSVGGDLVKAYMLAREQSGRRAVAVATVGLDRVLGLLALFLVGALATLFPRELPESPELQTATALLWIGSLCGLVGLALLLHPATTKWRWVNRLTHASYVGKHIADLLHGVGLYQSQRGVVTGAMLLSIVGHGGLITGFYLCALSMQQPGVPDLGTHFYFMPNAELFGVLIPVPGGVGALEGAIQWFYVKLAAGSQTISPETAAATGFIAAITFRVVALLIAAIGAGYYFASRQEIAAAFEAASHEQGDDSTNAGTADRSLLSV